MKQYLILIVVFSPYILYSQTDNFNQDWQKLKLFCKGVRAYSMKMSVEVLFDKSINSKVNIETLVCDSNSITSLGENSKSVRGPQYDLSIDRELKLITLAKHVYQPDFSNFSNRDLQDTGFTIERLKSLSGRMYKLTYNKGPIESFVFEVDTLTGVVSYLEYNNRNLEEYDWRKVGKRTTIFRIQEFKILDSLSEDIFSEKNYIKKEKKNYTSLPPYTGYRVLNLNVK